jgi:putative transposase
LDQRALEPPGDGTGFSSLSSKERKSRLYKTELIRRPGPWRGIDDVKLATLTWIAWYNAHRLLEPLGCVPLAEFEQAFYAHRRDAGQQAVLT